MNVSPLDTRVPAVLLRTDLNPFHHGTLGAVRSLGRAGVEVHLVADCAASPVRGSRFIRAPHAPPRPGASPDEFAAVLRRVAARVGRPAVLVPLDDASAVAVGRLREELTDDYLLPAGPPPSPNRSPTRPNSPRCAGAWASRTRRRRSPTARRRRRPPPGSWACRWWPSGAARGCCPPTRGCAAR